MNDITNNDTLLSKIVKDYLNATPTNNRVETHEQVYKFIRWIGSEISASELTPFITSSYSDQTAVTAIKYVKPFLKYLYTKGFTATNLSSHLKGRKAARSTITSNRKRPQNISNLTPEGYLKLNTELEELLTQRIEVTVELRKAAADKDFRENAPLHAARDRKSLIEGRIQEIESILKTATIIKSSKSGSKVKIGDTVLLEDLSSGQQVCYILVDSKESNIAMGKCSTVSPIGKSLLNKEKGQIVEVIAPGGTFSFRIHKISHDI